MGLFTGLLTLPLVPVRSVVWLAERILDQAEREMYDPAEVRRQLAVVQAEREAGRLSDEEAVALEDELVGRMMARRSDGPGGGRGHPRAP